jgi:hypothetical protein
LCPTIVHVPHTYPFSGLVSLDLLVKLDHSIHTIVQRKTYIQSISTTIPFMHTWQSTIQRHSSDITMNGFLLTVAVVAVHCFITAVYLCMK